MQLQFKNRQDLIKAYIEFFKKKKHKEIPSSSLIPENDPTVLFTTAGMHPLITYLVGQNHPLGKRLVNVQKCIRTNDIDEVGDKFHGTFFEMLGNWSLGDYWKKEAISFTFEYLISILGLKKEKLAVTTFKGDKEIGINEDKESVEIWKSLGIAKERIAHLGKEDNWWGPAGETGPCGPCTEIFYYIGKKAPKKYNPNDNNWIEIGNNVFMEYNKTRIKAILVDAIYCLFDKDMNLNNELLKILKSYKTRLIVVTNADLQDPKNNSIGNLKKDDIGIFTSNNNPSKENPKYFKQLLDTYKLKPEEVIYFDHSKENIKSAKKAEITNVEVYKDNKQIKEFIKANMHQYASLEQKNVDFGGGLVRQLAILNNLDDIFKTKIYLSIIKEIEKLSNKIYDKNKEDTRAMRIIADHITASTFILGDEKGIKPSNIGQGYVLRRLIRRAVRYGKLLDIKEAFTSKVAKAILPIYPDYQELHRNHKFISQQLDEEEEKFNKTLEKGIKKFSDLIKDKKIITGKEAFLLFQSYGFPIEFTSELAEEKGIKVDLEEYNKEFKKHQDLSRTVSAGMFKSGLADNSEAVKKLHTATHLLHEVLKRVLSPDIKQKGSNITPERLRFDFNFPRKLTAEEIKKIESLVNQKIKESLPVTKAEIPLQDAVNSGAQSEFGAKYPELVSVYTIKDEKEKNGWFSREICTGPHVSNTSEIGAFKIIKEESSSAGIRRIKAVVE